MSWLLIASRHQEPAFVLPFSGKMCDPRPAASLPVCRTRQTRPERFTRARLPGSGHAAERYASEPGFMKIIRSKDYTASRAWGALDIANMNGITTRLHWTDKPYEWHVNDGEEVFAVLDGRVEMRYRENGEERSTLLETGDVFHATRGTEHVAHPVGEARILVIETEGSV
jgi:mannose-6-phosphate isomerase-like protein (cupin superfamily)